MPLDNNPYCAICTCVSYFIISNELKGKGRVTSFDSVTGINNTEKPH